MCLRLGIRTTPRVTCCGHEAVQQREHGNASTATRARQREQGRPAVTVAMAAAIGVSKSVQLDRILFLISGRI